MAGASMKARRAMWAGVRRAVRLAGEDLLARSERRAPRDLGHLAGTGDAHFHADETPRDGAECSSTVTYSGPYAAAQHEGFAIQHRDGREVVWVVRRYTTPGTGRHYLSDPLREQAGDYEHVIGLAAGAGLEGRLP